MPQRKQTHKQVTGTPADAQPARRNTFNSVHACDGLRDPAWRWRFARIAHLDDTVAAYPDPTVRGLVEFLRGGPDQIVVPSLSRPVSAKAIIELHEDRLKRLSLESRVLAYQDVSLAAERSGLPLDVCKAYCDVCFDVLDRLDARVCIRNKVILNWHHRRDFLRQELCWQAYKFGPVVAEHWLERLPELLKPEVRDLKTSRGRELEQLELLVLWREVSDDFADPELLPVYNRLLSRAPVGTSYGEIATAHVGEVLSHHAKIHQDLAGRSEAGTTRRKRDRYTARRSQHRKTAQAA